MKKYIKIIIILFFLPKIIIAAEMTVGLNSAFGMYDAAWREQKHFSINNTAYYNDDPWLFFEPVISFRIDNRWEIITKFLITANDIDSWHDDPGGGSFYDAENDYFKLYCNLTLRYYFAKFFYITTGFDISYLSQERYLKDNFSQFVDYSLETILPGSFLGIGFYVKIYKGLYFEFITSTLFQYGTSKMEINSQNYGIPFDTKDKETMAFGQNATIAFGYYFKDSGVDIALTFDSHYLMHIQNDNKGSSLDNIDGKDEKVICLGIRITYTFSLTGKVRPWAENNSDKIWIPTSDGKSTWL